MVAYPAYVAMVLCAVCCLCGCTTCSADMPSHLHESPVQFDTAEMADIDGMLDGLWEHDLRFMYDPDGRPLGDRVASEYGGIASKEEYRTYSETIGYALLRNTLQAIRFRREGNAEGEARARKQILAVWHWTETHMRRDRITDVYDVARHSRVSMRELSDRADCLMAWCWYPRLPDGQPGVMYDSDRIRRPANYIGNVEDGENTTVWLDGLDAAPDGELFAIAALRMYAILWPDDAESSQLLADACAMAKALREKCTMVAAGRTYLLASDMSRDICGLNPSYSFPALYDMIGDDLDPEYRSTWQSMKLTAMRAIVGGGRSDLHTPDGTRVAPTAKLPPNWVTFDMVYRFRDHPWCPADSWMGWDGIRTLAMVAVYGLQDPSCEAVLRYLTDNHDHDQDLSPRAFLSKQFQMAGKLLTGYRLDGQPIAATPSLNDLGGLSTETPLGNACYLSYFYAGGDADMTRALLARLKDSYSPWQGTRTIQGHEGTFDASNARNYFSNAWAYFGLAIADGLIEDYFALYHQWAETKGESRPHRTVTAADVAPIQVRETASRDLNANAWWRFEHWPKGNETHPPIAFKGSVSDWYLDGAGCELTQDGLGQFDVVYVDVKGTAGKLRVCLHTPDDPDDQPLFAFEVPAVSAQAYYIPLWRFHRQEYTRDSAKRKWVPRDTGVPFASEHPIEKLQIVALAETPTGRVDFTLNSVRLVCIGK